MLFCFTPVEFVCRFWTQFPRERGTVSKLSLTPFEVVAASFSHQAFLNRINLGARIKGI